MTPEKHFKPMTDEILSKMSPKDASHRLVDGNKRFLNQLNGKFEERRDLLEFVNKTSSDGQYPFAIVLSCVDSRMPTEIFFDQSVGDLFNARIAGNFVNEDILGSMEFACTRTNDNNKSIGAKLILVLGHTSCGAIGGASQSVFSGSSAEESKENDSENNLTQLLEKLTPAVNTTPLNLKDGETVANKKWQGGFIDRVAKRNVELTIDNILLRSNDLRNLHNSGAIHIEGAMYDVKSGKVTFFNENLNNRLEGDKVEENVVNEKVILS